MVSDGRLTDERDAREDTARDSPTIPAPPPSPDADALVTLSEVEMLQDGGTIWFRISGHPLAGSYHLQTPFLDGPRTLFRDGAPLVLGSDDERSVLHALRAWFDVQPDAERVTALEAIDRTDSWAILPQALQRAIPLHRVRAVIDCLQERQPGS